MEEGRVRGGGTRRCQRNATCDGSKRDRGGSHGCKRRCRHRKRENGNHEVAAEGWLLWRPRCSRKQRWQPQRTDSIDATNVEEKSSGATDPFSVYLYQMVLGHYSI